jgi:hypothetical protein
LYYNIALIKLELPDRILKNPQISSFIQIQVVPCGHMDRQADREREI